MIDLIKKIISRRRENITLVLLDNKGTDDPEPYLIKPFAFIGLLTGFNLVLCFLVAFFFYITPVGNMIFNKSDREVRQSIIEISHRVMSLQDSLHTRDKQLEDLRTVLAEGSDTTFSIHPMDSMDQQEAYYENRPQSIALDPQVRIQNVDVNQIIYSRNLTGEPDFPADPPLTGTVTRIFDKDRTHMGIDIAASEGASAKVIADGVITNADWTINFGYVVHVHHGNGYISTYKHLSNLYKKKGDFIFKNDILGTVGRSGILTSGPHIHFELWRDGIALDPSLYLSNLINVN